MLRSSCQKALRNNSPTSSLPTSSITFTTRTNPRAFTIDADTSDFSFQKFTSSADDIETLATDPELPEFYPLHHPSDIILLNSKKTKLHGDDGEEYEYGNVKTHAFSSADAFDGEDVPSSVNILQNSKETKRMPHDDDGEQYEHGDVVTHAVKHMPLGKDVQFLRPAKIVDDVHDILSDAVFENENVPSPHKFLQIIAPAGARGPMCSDDNEQDPSSSVVARSKIPSAEVFDNLDAPISEPEDFDYGKQNEYGDVETHAIDADTSNFSPHQLIVPGKAHDSMGSDDNDTDNDMPDLIPLDPCESEKPDAKYEEVDDEELEAIVDELLERFPDDEFYDDTAYNDDECQKLLEQWPYDNDMESVYAEEVYEAILEQYPDDMYERSDEAPPTDTSSAVTHDNVALPTNAPCLELCELCQLWRVPPPDDCSECHPSFEFCALCQKLRRLSRKRYHFNLESMMKRTIEEEQRQYFEEGVSDFDESGSDYTGENNEEEPEEELDAHHWLPGEISDDSDDSA